ncbi:hypothetical protein [Devosia sp.]|uniref:hypothetical protein n=1 Tax=Devosia sp. TaxID=1871048 RepID=UPI00292FFEC5|nr:hypothetical protein [Devosia sp.]
MGNLVPRSLLAATATLAVAGLYGGLVRIGVPLPYWTGPAELHGLVMMQGVFGTLVPLERAVALRSPLWFSGPIISMLATAGLLAGLPPGMGFFAYVIAALIFVGMSSYVLRLQPTAFNIALLLGAGALLLASVQVLVEDGAVTSALPWWLAYLVLTISGERLELSRLMGQSPLAVAVLFAVSAALLLGCAGGLDNSWAMMSFAAGLMAMAAWLWHHDIARHTIRMRGQTRFMAAAILCGHGWLGVAGLLAFGVIPTAAGPDALIHAITIGFAMSMILGHALIILPAVANVRIGYTLWMFAPLALLQVAMGWRIMADWLVPDWRWPSGLLTVVALAGFAALGIGVRARARRRSAP